MRALQAFFTVFALVISQAALPQASLREGLAQGPYSSMRILYERTFLGVNVMDLAVTVDPVAQESLRRIAEGHKYSDERADQVSEVMLESSEILVEGTFVRDVSYRDFILEARSSVRCAEDEGIIDEAERDRVLESLPYWFAPVNKRGFKKGDRLIYRADGTTLRNLVVAADGTVLVNRLERGPQPIETMIASYFAPCSNFRENLVKSLFAGGKRQPS